MLLKVTKSVKSHISFGAKSHENPLTRCFQKLLLRRSPCYILLPLGTETLFKDCILLKTLLRFEHQMRCAILPISSLLATFCTIPVLKTLVKKVPVRYILLRTAPDTKTLFKDWKVWFRMLPQHGIEYLGLKCLIPQALITWVHCVLWKLLDLAHRTH